MSVASAVHAGHVKPAPGAERLAWAVAGMLAAVFAIMAVEYGFALSAGRQPWAAQWLALTVSEGFAFGARSTITYMREPYVAALPGLSAHMALGGLALGLGALQFVPSLRRRHPRLHRASGMLVGAAVLASMVGSISFLLSISLHTGSSGAAFHLGLWALALLTLGLLGQAALAIVARDFRSHMVWMAMLYAALATAPMLRLGWALLGNLSGRDQETVNLAFGTLVLLATVLLMTTWLARVGDRDLPMRAAPHSPAPSQSSTQPHTHPHALSRWPRWLVLALSVATAGVALHEGLLAPQGIDALGVWRMGADRLPPSAAPWALATLALMVLLPKAWLAGLRGEAPSGAATLALLGVGAGSVLMGLGHDASSLAHYATATFWVGYGATLLLALWLAHRVPANSSGRNAWLILALALAWLPSQLPALLALGLWLGAGFDHAMTGALVNGVGGVAVAGAVTGFAATLRLWPQRGPRGTSA